jgi:uncharacterized protein
MIRPMQLRPHIAAILLLIVAGCSQSPPTEFYTLSSMPLPPGGLSTPRTVVGVGPVALPDYLDRPQIVTRASGNRVMLADFDSWIEPINSMFTRVLVQNLSVLLASDNVISLPQRRDIPLNYQVEVDVTRFDADATGRAVLDARWRVYGKGGERLVEEGRSTIVEAAVDPGDYEAVVASMSKALGQMSREIAGVIETHRSG